MRQLKTAAAVLLAAAALPSCSLLDESLCVPSCHARTHASSSLVSFLYPSGQVPPPGDEVPELHVPLRVGLAFLPSAGDEQQDLAAAQKEQLLERIAERFRSRPFVSEIVAIPDYYLKGQRGYAGLEGLQRLYGVDLVALVSYDQVRHADDNKWSLGYLTIVGAFVVQGTRQQTTTLVDLAVVDPRTRSLVLRAGGTDQSEASSTLVDASRDARNAASAGYARATDDMINRFDAALVRFEQEVKEGKARVHVTHGDGHGSGGGGALGGDWLWLLGAAAGLAAWRRRTGTAPAPAARSHAG